MQFGGDLKENPQTTHCELHLHLECINQVPGQIIKEVTGHHSDCVRTYKRTSDKIRENASKIISGKKVMYVCGNEKQEKFSQSEPIADSMNDETVSPCQLVKWLKMFLDLYGDL